MDQLMLEQLRDAGVQRIQSQVSDIQRQERFQLQLTGDLDRVDAAMLVNAASPFVNEIAAMLGEQLPVANVLQQKVH